MFKAKTTFSYIYAGWIIALIGILISLYYGEAQGYTPCRLCWLQRTALFPLAILFPCIFLTRNAQAIWFTIPFSAGGGIVAMIQTFSRGSYCGKDQICSIPKDVSGNLAIFGLIGFAIIFLLTALNLLANYQSSRDL